MARVAREMVERAGVNVEKLLDMLIRNASAELTTAAGGRGYRPPHPFGETYFTADEVACYARGRVRRG